MNDNLDQVMGYVRGAWRFRWLALSCAWVICLLGWAVVGILPDIYEANSRVYVDTSSDLGRLLEDQIVESDVDSQLDFVQLTMLSRAQLSKVAEITGLDEGVTNPAQQERLVEMLRRAIRVSGGQTDFRGRRDNMYSIGYQHADREKAIEVVETLLNSFFEDIVDAKRSQSEASGEFLRGQISEYENRLQEAEQKLAEFNRENFDRLPNLQSGYFDQVQNYQDELEEARKELRLAESKLDNINKQAEGESPRVFDPSEADPNSIEGQIYSTEARLNELLLRYTENHPDVIAAREMLENLNVRKEAAYAEARAGDGSGISVNNPVLQALLISRNEAEAEVATLRAEVDDRTSKIAELRTLIDETPEVEAELARLNRDYDIIKEHYQSLLDSLEREQLSRSVYQSEQVEFRMVDPPTASLEPVKPNRLILFTFVLFAACGAGAGAAFLMDQLKPSFQDARDLQIRFNLPTIGTVSNLATATNKTSGILTYTLAFGALGLTFISVVVLDFMGLGLRTFL